MFSGRSPVPWRAPINQWFFGDESLSINREMPFRLKTLKSSLTPYYLIVSWWSSDDHWIKSYDSWKSSSIPKGLSVPHDRMATVSALTCTISEIKFLKEAKRLRWGGGKRKIPFLIPFALKDPLSSGTGARVWPRFKGSTPEKKLSDILW